jgi:hypothetical protein
MSILRFSAVDCHQGRGGPILDADEQAKTFRTDQRFTLAHLETVDDPSLGPTPFVT